MKKYFMQLGNSAGSLAVEKHLWAYIKDNLDYYVVTERAINKVVDCLQREMEQYLDQHRSAHPLNISSVAHYDSTRYINAGSLTLTLIEIQGQYGE